MKFISLTHKTDAKVLCLKIGGVSYSTEVKKYGIILLTWYIFNTQKKWFAFKTGVPNELPDAMTFDLVLARNQDNLDKTIIYSRGTSSQT